MFKQEVRGNMMKKLIMLLTICMMCLLAVSASAAEKNDEAPPINWEISMMPKPTAEEIEAARWSIVLENTMGVYAYDMDSLYFPEEKNGVVNKDLVNVIVKTVFTDKELLKRMNKTYLMKKMNLFLGHVKHGLLVGIKTRIMIILVCLVSICIN